MEEVSVERLRNKEINTEDQGFFRKDICVKSLGLLL
jgi:hypothetical protein